MKTFTKKIKNLCNLNKRVAMFIDMDGTINEYVVFAENTIPRKMEDNYMNIKPISQILEILKEIGKIASIDLYILSLSRTKNLTQIKKDWFKKYVSFIPEENLIILIKETGDYTNENRDKIKAVKMLEKADNYDYFILLDDDHRILKQTANIIGNVDVYHISSALVWFI